MKNFFAPLRLADKFILIFVFLLGCMSLLMLESTVYDEGFVLDRVVWVQALAYVLGFAAMMTVLHLDYTMFIGFSKPLYIASILILLLVYIPGLGQEQYGSRAWINLGVTTLQPSEFVKILFILLMANYLSNHREDIKKFRGVLLSGLYALPIIAIVLKEDLGSALVYMIIWLFMVFFAGIDYKILIKSIVAALAALPVIYNFLGDYQKQRIEAFLHPDNVNLPGNYQVWQRNAKRAGLHTCPAVGFHIFSGSRRAGIYRRPICHSPLFGAFVQIRQDNKGRSGSVRSSYSSGIHGHVLVPDI